jgi:hypothetical protein
LDGGPEEIYAVSVRMLYLVAEFSTNDVKKKVAAVLPTLP